MTLLTQGKTNWRYILIVLILALLVGGGILWWVKTQEVPPVELPDVEKQEKNVEIIEVEQEELEIVINFCREKGYYEPDFLPPEEYLSPKGFSLNFIDDENKEIIGLCWRVGGALREGLLFVLKKENNQWELIWEKEGEIGQRYETFQGLQVIDIDKDGIEEIIYRETGWTLFFGEDTFHLYSSKHQEWFWRRDTKETVEDGTGKEEINFSPNLDLEKYRAFKEYLKSTKWGGERDGWIIP